MKGPDMSEMVIKHGAEKILFACRITKARIQTHTHTHSEYVTIIAFPRRQQSRERASVLHYTYTACLCSTLCPYPRHAVFASNPR